MGGMTLAYLVQHGEKEPLPGDPGLTETGQQQATRTGRWLRGVGVRGLWTSPMRRARETCELAGLAERAEIDPDLMEWNYGDYEGLTSEQIHVDCPGWTIFKDGGGPGGETPEQVGVRADRVIARLRPLKSDAALFAHGHVLRVLAARWLGLAPGAGSHFLLDTATLSVLSTYGEIAAFKRWNVSPVER